MSQYNTCMVIKAYTCRVDKYGLLVKYDMLQRLSVGLIQTCYGIWYVSYSAIDLCEKSNKQSSTKQITSAKV